MEKAASRHVFRQFYGPCNIFFKSSGFLDFMSVDQIDPIWPANLAQFEIYHEAESQIGSAGLGESSGRK